ncbi:hypothetical protein QTP70_004902 [Hemibagrus guttatus]|uniref:Growth differentiation factor 9 n=1 Tax=Hemibagrus guttatus TaxID=175788 RepID=A0AAE0QLM9_9TELE|nr:hypothetical protein QTP70_004902 [Hemibagrus guttatus]
MGAGVSGLSGHGAGGQHAEHLVHHGNILSPLLKALSEHEPWGIHFPRTRPDSRYVRFMKRLYKLSTKQERSHEASHLYNTVRLITARQDCLDQCGGTNTTTTPQRAEVAPSKHSSHTGVNNALEAATINLDPVKAKLPQPEILLCSLLSYKLFPSLRSDKVQSSTALPYDVLYCTCIGNKDISYSLNRVRAQEQLLKSVLLYSLDHNHAASLTSHCYLYMKEQAPSDKHMCLSSPSSQHSVSPISFHFRVNRASHHKWVEVDVTSFLHPLIQGHKKDIHLLINLTCLDDEPGSHTSRSLVELTHMAPSLLLYLNDTSEVAYQRGSTNTRLGEIHSNHWETL